MDGSYIRILVNSHYKYYMEPANHVRKEDYILLIDNRKDRRLLRISDNRKFKWRKIQIDLQQLLTHPYFTTFEVEKNGAMKVIQKAEGDQPDQQGEFPSHDNREIYTDQASQLLEHGDIEQLKKNTDPQTLIDMISQNNQQFEKRTQYSKEKYLKRKQAKYFFTFTVYRPTIQNVAEYYYAEDSKAISNIRWDAFALFLHLTSTSPSMLVFEKSKGLLPCSLILRGAGTVSVITEEVKQHSKIVNQQLNLTKQQSSRIQYVDMKSLLQSQTLYSDYDSKPIVSALKSRLYHNAIVTVYSLYLQPLTQVFEEMMSNREFVNIQLFDTFTRQYQVLKNRTHPMMSMEGFGGYILYAIKVKPDN